MKKKFNVTVRTDVETREKLKDMSRRISSVQKSDVPIGEVLRRISNVDRLGDVLLTDAEIKRRVLR